MFDDPRKKLNWMKEELFEAEYGEEDIDEEENEYDEIFDTFEGEFDQDEEQEFLSELHDLLDDDPETPPVPIRRRRMPNPAVDYRRTAYADEEFDESTALLVEKRSRRKGEKKKKGIKGLAFLALLEILAILAVMGWWLQWLI